MGGLGSGRQGSGAATVECFRKIDLAALERINLVNAGDQQAIGSTLVELRRDGLLIYYFRPERTEEFVSFLYTATQFGGRRRWLSCPRCRRRVRVLYRAQRFRCRKCLGLVYESTRQPWHQRVIDQADKLAYRVAGPAAAVYDRDEFPDKPKRMRWTTYHRLEERYYGYMNAWAVGFTKRFGRSP
jgi:hypothetical protein